jgi:hypothetical protein
MPARPSTSRVSAIPGNRLPNGDHLLLALEQCLHRRSLNPAARTVYVSALLSLTTGGVAASIVGCFRSMRHTVEFRSADCAYRQSGADVVWMRQSP